MKNTLKNSNNKAAFTLAEVLITLGIIGVVAAITIPALHTKITKIVLKNQIKKTISEINQHYRRVKEDRDGIICDTPPHSDCTDFNTAFINSFKIARVCNGNGLRDKCVPEYVGLNALANQCPRLDDNHVYNTNTIYVTLDGVIFIPYQMDWRSIWLVDVNGLKGPNKAGWDLFQFTMDLGSENEKKDKPIFYVRGCINQLLEVKDGLTTTSKEVSFEMIDNW
jgi:prepilin-type N-terminal cleavage/methylation domain-containing protein